MRRLGAGIAAILALAALAYIPAVGGGFIWDDDYYVTENPTLRTADGLRAIWTDPGATPQYYPLTHTSFWIEYRLWGLEPAGYHVVNVLLHALAAVVLWRLLHALGVPGAWLAAAVFAVHPVHVESVAWITERKNVLSGMLYLASATCWVRYLGLDSEQERDPAAGWAAAGAVLFVGALLAKTVTASLPMSLLLVAFWKGKRLRAGALVLLGAMLAAGVLMGSLTSWLERNQIGAVDGPWDLGWWERVGVAGRAWWLTMW